MSLQNEFTSRRSPLRINADTQNSLLRIAQEAAYKRFDRGELPDEFGTNAVFSHCKNTSGSAIPRFGIVSITGSLADPGGGAVPLQHFKQQPAFLGAIPASTVSFGKFGIAYIPLHADRIDWIQTAGVAICKVRINKTWHEWCDVKASDATQLDSHLSGSARILVRESVSAGSTGWCIVKLGDARQETVKGTTAQIIVANGTGNVTVNYGGNTETISAKHDWIHDGSDLGSGVKVIAEWFNDANEWRITSIPPSATTPPDKVRLVKVKETGTTCATINKSGASCIWTGKEVASNITAAGGTACGFTHTEGALIWITTSNQCNNPNELRINEIYLARQEQTWDPVTPSADSRPLYVVDLAVAVKQEIYRFSIQTGDDFSNGTAQATVTFPDGSAGPGVVTVEDPLGLFLYALQGATGWCAKYHDGATDRYFAIQSKQQSFYGRAKLTNDISGLGLKMITGPVGITSPPFHQTTISATQADNWLNLTGKANDDILIMFDNISGVWRIISVTRQVSDQEVYKFRMTTDMSGGTAQVDVYQMNGTTLVAAAQTLNDPRNEFPFALGDTITGANGHCVLWNGAYYVVHSEQRSIRLSGQLVGNLLETDSSRTVDTLKPLDPSPFRQLEITSVSADNRFKHVGKDNDVVTIEWDDEILAWFISDVPESGYTRVSANDPLALLNAQFHNYQAGGGYLSTEDLLMEVMTDTVGGDGTDRLRIYEDISAYTGYSSAQKQRLLRGPGVTLPYWEQDPAAQLVKKCRLTTDMSGGTATANIFEPSGAGPIASGVTVNDIFNRFPNAKADTISGSVGDVLQWTDGNYYLIHLQQQTLLLRGQLTANLLETTSSGITIDTITVLNPSPWNLWFGGTSLAGVTNPLALDGRDNNVCVLAWNQNLAVWYILAIQKSGTLRTNVGDILGFLDDKLIDKSTYNAAQDLKIRFQQDVLGGGLGERAFVDSNLDLAGYTAGNTQSLIHLPNVSPSWRDDAAAERIKMFELRSNMAAGTALADIYEPNNPAAVIAASVTLNDPFNLFPNGKGDSLAGANGACILWTNGQYYVVHSQQQTQRLKGQLTGTLTQDTSSMTIDNLSPLDQSPFNQWFGASVLAENRFKIDGNDNDIAYLARDQQTNTWYIDEVTKSGTLRTDLDGLDKLGYLKDKWQEKSAYAATEDQLIHFVEVAAAGLTKERAFIDFGLIPGHSPGIQQVYGKVASGGPQLFPFPGVSDQEIYRFTLTGGSFVTGSQIATITNPDGTNPLAGQTVLDAYGSYRRAMVGARGHCVKVGATYYAVECEQPSAFVHTLLSQALLRTDTVGAATGASQTDMTPGLWDQSQAVTSFSNPFALHAPINSKIGLAWSEESNDWIAYMLKHEQVFGCKLTENMGTQIGGPGGSTGALATLRSVDGVQTLSAVGGITVWDRWGLNAAAVNLSEGFCVRDNNQYIAVHLELEIAAYRVVLSSRMTQGSSTASISWVTRVRVSPRPHVRDRNHAPNPDPTEAWNFYNLAADVGKWVYIVRNETASVGTKERWLVVSVEHELIDLEMEYRYTGTALEKRLRQFAMMPNEADTVTWDPWLVVFKNIRFSLQTNLALGGATALAVIIGQYGFGNVQAGTACVVHSCGIFQGVAGKIGVATWRDGNNYEIMNLECP